jgi:PAS domain S-box-containing protein
MKRLLIILVAVVLAGTASLLVLVHFQWYEDAVKRETVSHEEMAYTVGLALKNLVQDIHHTEASLGKALSATEPFSNLRAKQLLKASEQEFGMVRAFCWVDATGRVVASSDPRFDGADLAGSPYFRKIIDGQEWVLSDLAPEFAGDEVMTVVVATGIRDAEGRFQGAIVAALDPERLTDKELGSDRVADARFSLYDSRGYLVFRNPPASLPYAKRDFRDSDPLLKKALEGQLSTGRMRSALDNQRLIAARIPVPELGWVAGAGRPEQAVLDPITQDMVVHAAILILVITALTMLAGMLVNRRFSRPLAGLKAHVAAVGRGDLDHRAEVYGIKELQDLAESFNRMATSLREARDGLENRVSERTAELVAANTALEKEVTERREAEQRLRLTNSLLELSARAMSRKEYLDAVLSLVGEWVGCECRGIRVTDTRGRIPYESYAGFTREFWDHENWLSVEADNCACTRIMRGLVEPEDRSLLTPAGSFRFDDSVAFAESLGPQERRRFRGECMRSGYRSLACIPIRDRNRPVGVLHLADPRSDMLPLAKVQFLESMLPLVGEALQRFTAEDAVREQAALLDLALDAIFVRDLERRITFWNHGAENTYGWTRQEALGQSPHELLKTQFPVPLTAILETLNQEGWWEGELVQRHRNGITLTVAAKWALQRDREGRPLAILEINRDISRRKKAEEELAQYRAHLEELVQQRTAELEAANSRLKAETEKVLAAAEKLTQSNRDLEQFAYVASHDLQEPLRIVVGYLQLLERRYMGRLDSQADEFIGFAVEGAVRMQQLITDLLEYSRVGTQPAQLTDVNANVPVDRALAILKKTIEETGAVVTHDPLPTVKADAGQLTQLFQNLMGNAIKFRGTDPPRIHISARPDGNRWIFSVRDNGIGLEQQYAERIFVIFQRLHTRQEYAGTGMGLAICKRIVERHGGRIWVESSLGQGATFYFTL